MSSFKISELLEKSNGPHKGRSYYMESVNTGIAITGELKSDCSLATLRINKKTAGNIPHVINIYAESKRTISGVETPLKISLYSDKSCKQSITPDEYDVSITLDSITHKMNKYSFYFKNNLSVKNIFIAVNNTTSTTSSDSEESSESEQSEPTDNSDYRVNNFHVIVSCENIDLLTSSFPNNTSHSSVKKYTNGNSPIVDWAFTIKNSTNEVETGSVTIKDISSGTVTIDLNIDVKKHVNGNLPIYITHPLLNLLFSYKSMYDENESNSHDNDSSIIVNSVFTVESTFPAGFENARVEVIPKLLSINLVQLTFKVTGVAPSSTYATSAKLCLKETLGSDIITALDLTARAIEELCLLPYSQFFFETTGTTSSSSSSNSNTIKIKNLKYYDNFNFSIALENLTNYYTINISTDEKLKFNYFFHIIQPKTFDNSEASRNFYMYYALFATCYCDSNGQWYLYFNPGGYIDIMDINIGLSIMTLDGDHVVLGCVELSRNINDSSVIYKESKSLGTYTEYGTVDTNVTIYDNFIDSTIDSISVIDDKVSVITNIAENVLDYEKTKLYLDNEMHTGLFVTQDESSYDVFNVQEFVDGDLSYPTPIKYNSESNKYNIVIYSKQFSLLFDKKITKNDIKEISIVGPIEYNIFENITERPFGYIQTGQKESAIIEGDGESTITGTHKDSIYQKIEGECKVIDNNNDIIDGTTYINEKLAELELDTGNSEIRKYVKLNIPTITVRGIKHKGELNYYALQIYTNTKINNIKPYNNLLNQMGLWTDETSVDTTSMSYGDNRGILVVGTGYSYTLSEDKQCLTIYFESAKPPIPKTLLYIQYEKNTDMAKIDEAGFGNNTTSLQYVLDLFNIDTKLFVGYDISEVEYFEDI